jgi:drug/metabolite transporter (DMT)-like permease
LSEDRGDSPRLAGDHPPLLKRLLFGGFAGVLIIALERFGGLFRISSSSLWKGILAIVAGGCAFGVVLVVVVPWVSPEDRLKGYCLAAIAGGAAGESRG